MVTSVLLLCAVAGCGHFYARFVDAYQGPACDLEEQRVQAVLAEVDRIARAYNLTPSRLFEPPTRILASYYGEPDITVSLTLSGEPLRLGAMVRDMSNPTETKTTASLFADLQGAFEKGLPGCDVNVSGGRHLRGLFAP